MKVNKNYILLFLIILVAAFLRLSNLGTVPPSATVDEVSIGFNAYSILKTGADEYGDKLPVLLRAYDDWRPALYVYLVIPFVALLDLTVLSVRLPSAILSIISLVSFYFLVKELFKDFKPKIEIRSFQMGIAELATLFLAVSPWHIYISRLGHEVNAFFSFLLLGIFFFLRFLSGKSWNLILSSIFLGLSFSAYQSGKIVVPILLVILLLLYFKKLFREKTYFLASVLVGFLIVIPIISQSFGDNSLIRYKATSIFLNSPAYFEEVSERYASDLENEDLLGQVFDNRKVASVLLVSKAYLSHFDPVWLSFNSGYEPFKAPVIGLLYLFELPLIFFGILFLLKSQIKPKFFVLILLWGLVAVLPGSITTGNPHAMRSFAILPVLQILAALGFTGILVFIKNKRLQWSFLTVSIFVLLTSVLWFHHSYFSLLPKELYHHFQYGPAIAFSEVKKLENNYDEIIVSNKDILFESYMFYLYINKYDPHLYQESGGTVSGGFDKEHRIGKYYFGGIENKLGEKRLYVINPEEVTEGMKIVKEIKYPNEEVALLITEIK